MNLRRFLPLLLSLIGLFFSLYFQSLANFDHINKTVDMTWYWVGAGISYLFSFLSTWFNCQNVKQKTLKSGWILLSSFFSIAAVVWTSIVIILWQAEF